MKMCEVLTFYRVEIVLVQSRLLLDFKDWFRERPGKEWAKTEKKGMK